MAHIPVAGIGGLGLIAAGIVIALNVPEIGWSLLAGVGLGGALAVALIAYRSRGGRIHGDERPSPPSALLVNDYDHAEQQHIRQDVHVVATPAVVRRSVMPA